MKFLTLLCLIPLFSCSPRVATNNVLDTVEPIINVHPDSALIVIKQLNQSDLTSSREQARYSLFICNGV